MRYVGYDHFRKRPADIAPGGPPVGGFLTPALLFSCVALLVLSRVDHGFIANARVAIADALSPAVRIIMVPLEPVRAAGAAIAAVFSRAEDLERLRNENETLKGWEARARDLERQLGELGAAAKAARDRDIGFVTARVIATSAGPFVRSAMIGAGQGEGLKRGYPVISGEGLAGRVASVGKGMSRMLLITDAESRVPVFVGPQAIRAVLSGDNGVTPRLTLLPPGSAVKPGEEVLTSGLGGLFPRGIRIGIVTGSGERPEVKPHADLDRLDYISVLFYEPNSPDLVPLEQRSDSGIGEGRR